MVAGLQVRIGSLAGGLGRGRLELLIGPSLGAQQVEHAVARLPARPDASIWGYLLQADQAHAVAVLAGGNEVLEAGYAILVLLIHLVAFMVCRCHNNALWVLGPTSKVASNINRALKTSLSQHISAGMHFVQNVERIRLWHVPWTIILGSYTGKTHT